MCVGNVKESAKFEIIFFILKEKQSSWQKSLISDSVHVSVFSPRRRHLYIFNSVPN